MYIQRPPGGGGTMQAPWTVPQHHRTVCRTMLRVRCYPGSVNPSKSSHSGHRHAMRRAESTCCLLACPHCKSAFGVCQMPCLARERERERERDPPSEGAEPSPTAVPRALHTPVHPPARSPGPPRTSQARLIL